MTKYDFGNIEITKQEFTIGLKSRDFKKEGQLGDKFIKNSIAILNGEKIDFDKFIRQEVQKKIDYYLKQKVTPLLQAGHYSEKIEFEYSFEKNQLTIGNIGVLEISFLLDIEFSYSIIISNEIKNEFQTYNNRLIAFFDILGFSKVLENSNLHVLYTNYAKLIDEANTHIFQINQPNHSPNFEKAQFLFDSIVLVSKPINDIKNVSDFINGCSSLFEKAFRQRLPLRGAITIGDFIDTFNKNIFLSSAFSKLVRQEKEQEWAGCIITEKAENIVLDAVIGANQKETLEVKQNSILFSYKVPLKNKNEKFFLCLNYYYFLSTEEINLGLEYLKGDEKKYNNMKLYTDYFMNLKDDKRPYGENFIKIMKTRSSFRYKLVDNKGSELIPKKTFKLPCLVMHGNSKIEGEMIFKGESDE